MADIEFDIDLPEVINVDPDKSTTNLDDPTKNQAPITPPASDVTSNDNPPSDTNTDTDSDNDDLPFYLSVLEQSGLELNDDDLKLFDNKEDTPETLQETIDFIINKRIESQRSNILSEYPELEELYATLKTGGNVESFIQNKQKAIDFSNIKIKNDDVFTQRQVVKEYLKLKNIEDDVADEMISTYEKEDKLEDFSKKALESVKSHYSTLSKKAKEEMAALEAAQQAEYIKQVNDAKELVKKGKLANIQLPKEQSEELVNYVYSVDKDGYSAYRRDIEQLTQEQILAVAYLIKNKLDFSKVVQTQIKNEKAKSIRDMFKNNTNPGQRNQNQRKPGTNISFSDLEIS